MTKKAKYIFTKKDAKHYAIPGGDCYLFPDSPTGRLSSALVDQVGRYPAKGYQVNDVCTESFLVLEGNLKFTINGKTKKMHPMDVAYIPPKSPYAIKGDGKVFVFIEPKWDPKQNHAA